MQVKNARMGRSSRVIKVLAAYFFIFISLFLKGINQMKKKRWISKHGLY